MAALVGIALPLPPNQLHSLRAASAVGRRRSTQQSPQNPQKNSNVRNRSMTAPIPNLGTIPNLDITANLSVLGKRVSTIISDL
jgi:hypothetical protein